MEKPMLNMDTMPLRWGHFRVLMVALLGQLIGAALLTLLGIILPLMQLAQYPELTSFQQGFICSIELFGIVVGSLLIGHLSDKFGYLTFFRICPTITLCASVVLLLVTPSLPVLMSMLFLMGVAIGGGYSLDSDYISEIMPKRWRQLMVGVAKASAAIGNLLMAGVCFWLLRHWHDPALWNKLMITIAAVAALMILLRIRFDESPGWYIAHERMSDAENAVKYFLGNDVDLGEIRQRPSKRKMVKVSWSDLFTKKNRSRLILTTIPWACEGVGVYGIGIFTPILVMALGLESASEQHFDRVLNSIEITAYINVFILIGFIVGLMLVKRKSSVVLQYVGFGLSAVALVLMLLAYSQHWLLWISLASFMAFELFLNAGPHLTTYILPAKVYSLEERGSGVGFSAAIGKIGAIVGVFFVPLLLKWGGVSLVLIFSIVVFIAGGLVTWFAGRNLPDNQ